MNGITLIAAFFAGIASFLAPCVLPIIPGFLAYLGGASTSAAGTKRKEIFLNSLLFVLGFSVVFALLGVLLNSILSKVAYDAQAWLARAGGALIIFFGLYLIGLIHIPFLDKEYKWRMNLAIKSRYITSFLFGVAFAVGWTPCVGPALGIILGLAASHPASTFLFLLIYSLGLGVPFLIVGLFVGQATQWINKHGVALKYVNIAFGIMLTALGVLVFTESLNLIGNWDFLNHYFLQ